MEKQEVGVAGLAVMGRNLALNLASRGYLVAVYNRTPQKTEALLQEAGAKTMRGAYSPAALAAAVAAPRKIILMVKAGRPVDDMIAALAPHLAPGDVLIDGGNSFYRDTIRRCARLAERGVHLMGVGISGGGEGALLGPAVMPGGPAAAYGLVEKILTDMAAKVGREACCAYLGGDGAGHFVKMVHNGIEYADMQLICETYWLLKNLLGLAPARLAEVFGRWNEGELNSYLIEITAAIFRKIDGATGRPLIDLIRDAAGQKGTGKWTVREALDIGAPAPTIAAAVFERSLSALQEERAEAAGILSGPSPAVQADYFVEAARRALYAGKICAYAQGFGLLAAAAKAYGWPLKLDEIAKIFRGGCVIRARFLERIISAYRSEPRPANLLLDDYCRDIMERYQPAWRQVVAAAALNGLPAPALAASLAYFDSYRAARLPANLLQAQRDYFGAHTYGRIDRDGIFHTQW